MRELRNVVQRAYVMASGNSINEEWLPDDPHGANSAYASSLYSPKGSAGAPARRGAAAARGAASGPSITIPIGTSMAEAERQLILATLEHFNQQKERTAAALGVSLKTLYNRLKEYAADKVDVDARVTASAARRNGTRGCRLLVAARAHAPCRARPAYPPAPRKSCRRPFPVLAACRGAIRPEFRHADCS